jgi:tRNA threonylcarbamoyladenosine biosynthesis protein TsaE
VLVRGIATGMGIDPGIVRSPTFVLHHVYRAGEKVLHHLDLYRLGPGADIRLLDVEDMLQSGGVVLVEWGEHAPRQDGSASLTIDIDDDGTRVISPPAGASERLLGAWADGAHQ